ncbi:MAG: hypothetical protein FXF54_01510 [Kosmotoga sp.]|nr:MAG: hypothetical protein FXF54_01510 [Kosmotoga sp.]
MDSKTIILIFLTLVVSGLITIYAIDKPPSIEKITGPAETVENIIASFVWDGQDPDGRVIRYEYRKDGKGWESNGKKNTYIWTGYTEGEHTFEVRARDNNGKASEIIKWSFTYKPSYD